MADEWKEDKELIEALLKRQPRLRAALAESEIVDDVICRRLKMRTKKSASDSSAYDTSLENLPESSVLQTQELAYLPKGKAELPEEYQKRIGMTPQFFETPGILKDRQGAMFSSPPEIEGESSEDLDDFWEDATLKHGSGEAVAASVSAKMQRRGLCAIFVDRAPLPADVEEKLQDGGVSEAEREARNLGRPILAVYSAEQVLWIEEGQDGLNWIKVVEAELVAADWRGKPKLVQTVRIIDRQNVTSYQIEDGKRVSAPKTISHEMKLNGEPVVPVAVAAPFSDDDGCPRSVLQGSAEADVAATQILSDLRWSLFLLGNPILTFKTDKDDSELKTFNTNSSRYIPLKLGNLNQDGESLEFIKLDPTGIEFLIGMHDRFVMKAREQAGQDAPGATTQPTEQSGISRAWQFKTGEERVLFLLTTELKRVFDTVLQLVAEMTGGDPGAVSIKFNNRFENIGGPKETVEVSEKMLSIAERYGAQDLAVVAVMRAVSAAYPSLDEKTLESIENQIKAKKTADVQAEKQAQQETKDKQFAAKADAL